MGGFLGLGRKIAVGQYGGGLAAIVDLAGQRLLHRLVAHAAMITLALDGIGSCPLAGRDVDAIVATGNGDIDAAEAVPFQHLGAEIFKIMAVHFVNILKADDSFHGQASLFSPTGIKQSRLPEQTALGNPIAKRGISRFFPKKRTPAVILLYIIYTYVRKVKEFVV